MESNIYQKELKDFRSLVNIEEIKRIVEKKNRERRSQMVDGFDIKESRISNDMDLWTKLSKEFDSITVRGEQRQSKRDEHDKPINGTLQSELKEELNLKVNEPRETVINRPSRVWDSLSFNNNNNTLSLTHFTPTLFSSIHSISSNPTTNKIDSYLHQSLRSKPSRNSNMDEIFFKSRHRPPLFPNSTNKFNEPISSIYSQSNLPGDRFSSTSSLPSFSPFTNRRNLNLLNDFTSTVEHAPLERSLDNRHSNISPINYQTNFSESPKINAPIALATNEEPNLFSSIHRQRRRLSETLLHQDVANFAEWEQKRQAIEHEATQRILTEQAQSQRLREAIKSYKMELEERDMIITELRQRIVLLETTPMKSDSMLIQTPRIRTLEKTSHDFQIDQLQRKVESLEAELAMARLKIRELNDQIDCFIGIDESSSQDHYVVEERTGLCNETQCAPLKVSDQNFRTEVSTVSKSGFNQLAVQTTNTDRSHTLMISPLNTHMQFSIPKMKPLYHAGTSESFIGSNTTGLSNSPFAPERCDNIVIENQDSSAKNVRFTNITHTKIADDSQPLSLDSNNPIKPIDPPLSSSTNNSPSVEPSFDLFYADNPSSPVIIQDQSISQSYSLPTAKQTSTEIIIPFKIQSNPFVLPFTSFDTNENAISNQPLQDIAGQPSTVNDQASSNQEEINRKKSKAPVKLLKKSIKKIDKSRISETSIPTVSSSTSSHSKTISKLRYSDQAASVSQLPRKTALNFPPFCDDDRPIPSVFPITTTSPDDQTPMHSNIDSSSSPSKSVINLEDNQSELHPKESISSRSLPVLSKSYKHSIRKHYQPKSQSNV